MQITQDAEGIHIEFSPTSSLHRSQDGSFVVAVGEARFQISADGNIVLGAGVDMIPSLTLTSTESRKVASLGDLAENLDATYFKTDHIEHTAQVSAPNGFYVNGQMVAGDLPPIEWNGSADTIDDALNALIEHVNRMRTGD
jgi:hypothetical protein